MAIFQCSLFTRLILVIFEEGDVGKGLTVGGSSAVFWTLAGSAERDRNSAFLSHFLRTRG